MDIHKKISKEARLAFDTAMSRLNVKDQFYGSILWSVILYDDEEYVSRFWTKYRMESKEIIRKDAKN